MNQQSITKSIEKASEVIGKTWPLYSFVTSNPLAGFEKDHFNKAAKSAKKYLNAKIFPDALAYRNAWEQGEIGETELKEFFKENGLKESPEFYLQLMESRIGETVQNGNHDLDRIMAKWLAAFMDEGLAEWSMPYKEQGFYKAWRKLAIYDDEVRIGDINRIPKTPSEALKKVLGEYREEEYVEIFKNHLAALSGWVGYIDHRNSFGSPWQEAYPIKLEDYLGVRLFISHNLGISIWQETSQKTNDDSLETLQYIWLQAWEKTWQNQLAKILGQQSAELETKQAKYSTPDAQMVFCIDTRSEAMRRHVESKGNYETIGYAGFFGIAMDYKSLENGLVRKSCPPIVDSAYKVFEIPDKDNGKAFVNYKKKNELQSFWQYFLKRMKNMLPSAFGYVEGSGVYYGLSLLVRTLAPGAKYRWNNKNATSHEAFCQPEIHAEHRHADESQQIPLEEKVAIVKSAFDLTGWKNFAPLVLFVGHGSHSANNPFGSSLDCGACAASPGRHNARMLAKLANLPDVRRILGECHGINIPEETLFFGAEHNTTTDEIVIFDSNVPDSHQKRLDRLKVDLKLAQETATKERLESISDTVSLAHIKANDWAETRPEWGLAKNAGFIVGPRSLTQKVNLDGRCFLHSYDWKRDRTGKALEGIMQGPMVVTQWINNHYYFSTVDNNKFGGGSKTTHNITGKFGVVQGNGGDLKIGLPLQSVNKSENEMYHKPLRLSVVIQAPVVRVEEILERNENLKLLLDNEWIYLMVIDPTHGNQIKRYSHNNQWISHYNDLILKEHSRKEMDKKILEVITM